MKKISILFFISFLFFNNVNTTFAYSQQQINEYRQKQLLEQKINDIYQKGIQAYQSNNYSNAINYLSSIEKYYFNNSVLYTVIGESYRKLGNNTKAIPYLKKAIDLGAKDYTTLMGLGYAYMDIQNYSTSILYFQKASNEFKNTPDPSFFLGLSYKELKNNNGLLNAMLNVININPKYGVDPYIYSGNILSTNKLYDKSLNIYLKGLSYFPNDAVLNYYVGDLYSFYQNYDLALNYLNKSVQIAPQYLDAQYLLGDIYLKVDDLDNAMNQCQVTKKIDKEGNLSKNLCSAVQQKIQQKQMEQMVQQQIQQQIQDDIQQQIDQQVMNSTNF